MLELILGVLLAALAIIFWVLLRTYQHIPARELKRLARKGDGVAELLYRAVAYGINLKILLGSGIVIFGALSLAVFASSTNVWWALAIILVLAGLAVYVFAPGEKVTRGSIWLAKRAAPPIAWCLERINPVFDGLVRLLRKHRHVYIHTGLYEKSDLIELLEQQKGQPDSRISESEIGLLEHALTFGDLLVADALIPQRMVKLVGSNEAIGPVLMDELNRSGFSRFPVYEGTKENIVGILYLRDLVASRNSGTVADVMSHRLTYVHEDFTLFQVLQTFLKTKRHLFLVVNNFEELVGIVTIEDVLEQMIGKPVMDEFDTYDDMKKVAEAARQKEHQEHREDNTEPSELLEESA